MELRKRQDTVCEIADVIALLETAKETVLNDQAEDTLKLMKLAEIELRKAKREVLKSIN
ncbi:hypothetical protein [Caviibacterium pharyngocola]|uniref:hypothetical protein n=1 Tax=Caviibacterium pharyngocola TaxID=28159 RepID=UPI0013FD3479|nr:hypothetical protein [Caviibacterium pharyngocola]